MPPEPTPPPQTGDSPPVKRNRPALFRIGAVVFGILLVTVVVLLVLTSWFESKVVWMTPDELAKSLQPGPFTSIKQKVAGLTWPIWRHFRPNRPLVHIRSMVLAIPSAVAEPFNLEAPVARPASGLRAWTLSATQSEKLQQQVNKLPPERIVSAPQVSNASGGWASVSAGTTVMVLGKRTQTGVEVRLRAKAVKRSWDLTCSIIATEPIVSATNIVVGLQTNVATACRTMIPNGGALVIQSANRAEANGTNYWFIISPAAIDGQGKPIKF